MAPQAKRVKIGTLLDSGHLQATPVSKTVSPKFKRVRSKKSDKSLGQHFPSSPGVRCNSTLEPGLTDLFYEPTKSNSKSTKKRKSSNDDSAVSPCIADLLELSAKKSKTPQPNTVNEVFERYMEQDPFASIWDFIPRAKQPSPDKRPLTFFSPPKELPRTHSAPRIRIRHANIPSDSVDHLNKTVDFAQNAHPSVRKDQLFGLITPTFGKRLGASAYSPCNSAERNFSRINCGYSGLNNSNSSFYSPALRCSTPTADSFKTPSADPCRPATSLGLPLSGVKALFHDRSRLADSPAYVFPRTDSFIFSRTDSPAYHQCVPESVRKNVLLGVICFVDCKYNKEDRAKYVQKECISLGAKVEKNFTKKVTHVVFKGGKISTFIKAKETNIPIVSLLWLEACKVVGNMVDPALYPPTDHEKYEKEIPLEEARKRERFFKRGRNFLDRLNGLIPSRTRSGRNVPLMSATERKKTTKSSRPVLEKRVVIEERAKVPTKLCFGRPGQSNEKKLDSGDSDYASEGDSEDANGESKRRRSAPADIGGDVTSSQKSLTDYFPKQLKVEETAKSKPCDRTPQKELMNVLTGGYSTADKKRRKLFDPNQSLMSQPLPTTPIELSPYVKDSPLTRSGSRCRTTSSKKPATRCKSSSSKSKHRVREAKRPVTARKSLVPLLEQKEEEEETITTSRNSLACFDLTKKSKISAPKWQPRIAFTSLPKEDVARYKGIISRLGTFEVDSAVTKKTTHLLTSAPVKRTVNLLKALARGCWILDVEWLVHSEQSGKWMSEESFEHKSFSEAVTASRLGKQAFGKDYSMDLFSGCGPIFVDSDVQPPRLDLISLLKICCAKVVSVSSNAEIIITKRPLANDDSPVAFVNPQWILDSITHNKRMDMSKYKI